MAFFDPKYKLKVHVLQIILIHVVMGVSAPQLFLKGQPRTRANTIALGMSGKSMIIISYQILTEHRERFSRWRSYKAYAILNGLEIVFWAAVVFLILQANLQSCVGVSCTLRWIAVVVSIVITVVAVYMFIISYVDFRAHRMQREHKRSRRIMSADVEHGQPMDQLHLKSARVTIGHGDTVPLAATAGERSNIPAATADRGDTRGSTIPGGIAYLVVAEVTTRLEHMLKVLIHLTITPRIRGAQLDVSELCYGEEELLERKIPGVVKSPSVYKNQVGNRRLSGWKEMGNFVKVVKPY
ncbi:hypothetical protein CLAIMM_01188 [Cladophialophora immunda]|nr:hypothetical protein CLAIMM_01188 [Cladophialophora immunda]